MISHTTITKEDPMMRNEKNRLWVNNNLRSNQFFGCALSIVGFRRSHMGQCLGAIQADPPKRRKRKLMVHG